VSEEQGSSPPLVNARCSSFSSAVCARLSATCAPADRRPALTDRFVLPASPAGVCFVSVQLGRSHRKVSMYSIQVLRTNVPSEARLDRIRIANYYVQYASIYTIFLTCRAHPECDHAREVLKLKDHLSIPVA
jgi:hypothetical protein